MILVIAQKSPRISQFSGFSKSLPLISKFEIKGAGEIGISDFAVIIHNTCPQMCYAVFLRVGQVEMSISSSSAICCSIPQSSDVEK